MRGGLAGDLVVGDRGLGRSEWTVRVITEEATERQERRGYYGILDSANGANLHLDDTVAVQLRHDGHRL